MSDAKYDFGWFLDYFQGGVRVAKRKAGFEQYLGGPPAPGGSFVTPLDGAGLPSDILSQAPGVPQMKGDASFLQDRKSVVEGKSVSVRVDLGGRSFIRKKIATSIE